MRLGFAKTTSSSDDKPCPLALSVGTVAADSDDERLAEDPHGHVHAPVAVLAKPREPHRPGPSDVVRLS